MRIYAVSVGTASAQAIPFDVTITSVVPGALRTSLTFHNPANIDVFIAPAVDANGNPITPTVNGPGTLQVGAGAAWVIDAPGSVAWNAIAASPAVLTIIEYLS
jgi:hypothetical protein